MCHRRDKKEQEDYFSKNKVEYKCYRSKVWASIANQRLKKEGNEFAKDLRALIEKLRKGKNEESSDILPYSIMELKSLSKIIKGKRENDIYKTLSRTLNSDWGYDRDQIIKMLLSVSKRFAIVPILDGLYGGTACERNTDKS